MRGDLQPVAGAWVSGVEGDVEDGFEDLGRSDADVQRAADVDGELRFGTAEGGEHGDVGQLPLGEGEPGPGVDVGEPGLDHVAAEVGADRGEPVTNRAGGLRPLDGFHQLDAPSVPVDLLVPSRLIDVGGTGGGGVGHAASCAIRSAAGRRRWAGSASAGGV